MTSSGTHEITKIAKEFGVSGQKLNKWLHEQKVQYKIGGTWLLYAKYQNLGYTKSETIVRGDKSYMLTVWTEKGRQFIHDLYNKAVNEQISEDYLTKTATA